MSFNPPNDQDQMWARIAALFDDDAIQAQEPPVPPAVAQQSSQHLENTFEPAPPKRVREKPPASSTREETIRMIGEAIDVQTDFPGFDQLESPDYLSSDLNHLLAPEDTEEKLETQLDPKQTAAVLEQKKLEERAPDQPGPAMPPPENYDATPSGEQGRAQPQQNQAPFRRPDDPDKIAQAAEQQDSPGPPFSTTSAGPEEEDDDFLQDSSPRAFPGGSWKNKPAPVEEDYERRITDIMKTAGDDAVKTSQDAKAAEEQEADGDDTGEPKKSPPRNPFQSAPWEGG